MKPNRRSLLKLLALGTALVIGAVRVGTFGQPAPRPRSATPPGGRASPPGFRVGLNVPRGEYWKPARNFVNLLYDSGPTKWIDVNTGQTYAKDDWGWPRDVPARTPLTKVLKWMDRIHPRDAIGSSYLKPGAYKITTTGGWYIELTDQLGIRNHVPGTNVCTFTVSQSRPVHVRVQISHSGAPRDLLPGEFKAYEVAHEALLAADGFAFLPEALALYEGFTMLRNVDVSGANGEYPFRDADDVPPLTHYMGGFWPPELFARLCKAVGSGMWLSFPTCVDVADMVCKASNDTFQLVRNGTALPAPANGDPVMWTRADSIRPAGMDCGPYVVANRTATTFQLAHPSTPSRIITFGSDIPASYQTNATKLHDYEKAWDAWASRHFDAYPDCAEVRVEPFLENWNFSYIGAQVCSVLGNYYRSGDRDGGDNSEGHVHFVLKTWAAIERYYPAAHVRTLATGISAQNSATLDVIDTAGIISVGQPMAHLAVSVGPAMYVDAYQTPVPAAGKVDWKDPDLDIHEELDEDRMTEGQIASRPDLVTAWSRGAFSDAQWTAYMSNSFHFMNLHCRLWRDKMASHGRILGTHYDMVAYEWGNHYRRDRPDGDPDRADVDMEIQDSFIAWLFGSPSGVRFLAAYKAMLEYNGFTLCNHYHAFGDWLRWNGQLNQWGAVPYAGAEMDHPGLGGVLQFLRDNR